LLRSGRRYRRSSQTVNPAVGCRRTGARHRHPSQLKGSMAPVPHDPGSDLRQASLTGTAFRHRQQPLELVGLGAPRDHPLEHVGQPSQGLYLVELGAVVCRSLVIECIETSTYRLSIASRALQEMHDRTISVPDCVSFRTRSDCLSRALPPPAYLWGRGRTRCRCESSTCSRAWTSRGFAFLQTTDRAVSFSSTRPGCDCPWFLPYPRGKGPARRGSFGSSPRAAASCRLRSRHAAHRAFCRSFCSSVLGLTSRFGFTLASISTYALPITGSIVARSISSPVQASATVGCVVRGDLAHPTLREVPPLTLLEVTRKPFADLREEPHGRWLKAGYFASDQVEEGQATSPLGRIRPLASSRGAEGHIRGWTALGPLPVMAGAPSLAQFLSKMNPCCWRRRFL
jgi:hypothetical protein